jgi:hypothetical protein
VNTVDGDALRTAALTGDDPDGATGDAERICEELDQRAVGGIVYRRRRDTDENRVAADAVDGGVLRARNDANVDLRASRRLADQPRT